MSAALWVAQALLAEFFLFAGWQSSSWRSTDVVLPGLAHGERPGRGRGHDLVRGQRRVRQKS
jgi:hypothetical protein